MSFVNLYAFLAAAALMLLSASGRDRQISSYAMERTPVFGSARRAQKASDALSYISFGVMAAVYTIKHFPAIDEPFSYPRDHYHGGSDARSAISNIDSTIKYCLCAVHRHYACVQSMGGTEAIFNRHFNNTAIDDFMAVAAAGVLTSTATEYLKDYTGRLRPNGHDSLSYPSGHTTAAAWLNHSSARMIAGMNFERRYEIPAYGALTLLTLSMAWSRLEAGKHYPADALAGVLVGAALTDVSFAYFHGNGVSGNRTRGTRFELTFTSENSVTATGMFVTVEF